MNRTLIDLLTGTNHLLLCSNKYCLFISSEDFKTSRWKFRLSSLHRADVVQGNLVIYLSRASTPISNFLGAAANLGMCLFGVWGWEITWLNLLPCVMQEGARIRGLFHLKHHIQRQQ